MKTFRVTGRLAAKPMSAMGHNLPGVRRQAGNLAAAALQVAGGLAAGRGLLVDSVEQARRQAICQSCVEWWVSDLNRCAHPDCGCRLRFKTWLAAVKCPDFRW